MPAPRVHAWAICYDATTRRGVIAISRDADPPPMADVTALFELIDPRCLRVTVTDGDVVADYQRPILSSVRVPLLDDATATRH